MRGSRVQLERVPLTSALAWPTNLDLLGFGMVSEQNRTLGGQMSRLIFWPLELDTTRAKHFRGMMAKHWLKIHAWGKAQFGNLNNDDSLCFCQIDGFISSGPKTSVLGSCPRPVWKPWCDRGLVSPCLRMVLSKVIPNLTFLGACGSGEFCHNTPESSHLTTPGVRNASRFGQLVV